MMDELGLGSVKLFTTYADSGRMTGDNEIIELLRLSRDRGFVVLVHTEDDDMIEPFDGRTVNELPDTRPEESEISKAMDLAAMVKDSGGKLYMVHTSSGRTVKALVMEYADLLGESFHIESCPHYFTMDYGMYWKPKGSLFTMVPPLRGHRSVERIRKYSGFIETIGTDHCPYLKKEKTGANLVDIPMGIGSVEDSFRVMYGVLGTAAIDKMSLNPARIFGLYPKKGVLAVGADADFFVFDDSKPCIVEGGHSACDYNVYEGSEVPGRIISTACRGHFVVKDGQFKGGNGICLP